MSYSLLHSSLSKIFANLYQASVSYPFNRVRSIRFNAAFRSDKIVILPDDFNQPPLTLQKADDKRHYAILHAEYVHDDAINPHSAAGLE